MKKSVSLLLACLLLLSHASALEAQYTLPRKGTILQDLPDRGILPDTQAGMHPLIPGESPTTGLPWEGTYLPMLVQISNAPVDMTVRGRTVRAAGVGKRGTWGLQNADILYESALYGSNTRMTCLFSDSFAVDQPADGVGPVRSTRVWVLLLREEWQAGFVFSGGSAGFRSAKAEELMRRTGADKQGVLFNLLKNRAALAAKNRVQGVRAPDNLNVDILALRRLIPDTHTPTPRPFLFADESPYGAMYEPARTVHLDWGGRDYVSHFQYDEATQAYFRYGGQGVDPAKWAPYLTYAGPEDRSEEHAVPLSFANVILQRVEYENADDGNLSIETHSAGRGNADIFIGGRYIPGYWVRRSLDSPTVFYDDRGEEIRLNRGKTFIAHFPARHLCAFEGE